MSLSAAGEKTFRCEKSKRDVPISDPRCLNPKGYCKVRTPCPIHALERGLGRKSP